MASSLMASQTLINFLPPHSYITLSPKSLLLHLSKPRTLSLLSSPNQPPILSLSNPKPSSILKPTPKISRVFASSSSSTIIPNNSSTDSSENPTQRTISTILTLAISVSRLLVSNLKSISTNPSSEVLATIQNLHGSLVCTGGPMFFAALKDRYSPRPRPIPIGYIKTPLTVVASGMSILLDVYSGVLIVRIMLSWFPNIPWDRQPLLSAIRDLYDPYLILFRKIIPPIFGILDVSIVLAFLVLGALGSILNHIRGAYGVNGVGFLMIRCISSW